MIEKAKVRDIPKTTSALEVVIDFGQLIIPETFRRRITQIINISRANSVPLR